MFSHFSWSKRGIRDQLIDVFASLLVNTGHSRLTSGCFCVLASQNGDGAFEVVNGCFRIFVDQDGAFEVVNGCLCIFVGQNGRSRSRLGSGDGRVVSCCLSVLLFGQTQFVVDRGAQGGVANLRTLPRPDRMTGFRAVKFS